MEDYINNNELIPLLSEFPEENDSVEHLYVNKYNNNYIQSKFDKINDPNQKIKYKERLDQVKIEFLTFPIESQLDDYDSTKYEDVEEYGILDDELEDTFVDEIRMPIYKKRNFIVKRVVTKPIIPSSGISPGTYECPKCGLKLYSEAALNDHYIYSHYRYMRDTDEDSESDYGDDELCRCVKCNRIFINDNMYKDHECDEGSIELGDTMPIDPNGEFECPICKNKYSNANILGEHFIIAHNDYSELGILDEELVQEGFPGFDILEELYMTEKLSRKHIRHLIKHQEICSICCHKFKNKEDDYIPKENILNNYYNSDSELLYESDEESLDAKSDTDYEIPKRNTIKRSVYDEKLLDKINEFRRKVVKPLILRCCDFIICHDCLENTLRKANNLICPFCRFDHCKTNLKYFAVVEPGYYRSNYWIPWWTRHLEIFD